MNNKGFIIFVCLLLALLVSMNTNGISSKTTNETMDTLKTCSTALSNASDYLLVCSDKLVDMFVMGANQGIECREANNREVCLEKVKKVEQLMKDKIKEIRDEQ